MIVPEKPHNEAERIAALNKYQILDTLPEDEYDAITLIASQICGTPIALISLIDPTRQWFKSHHGLDVTETDRDIAFCVHAINEPENLLIIKDASLDERFHDNPLSVSDPNVIFYAGAPLVTPDGYPLGTLCVIDHEPGELDEEQQNALRALAGQVIVLLELRAKNRLLELKNDEISRLNQNLDAFTYRLSHDLKTPIRGIKSITEWFREDYWLKFNDQQKEWIGKITSRAEYMESVTEGLLNYSRITHNRISFSNFNLKSLLDETLGILSDSASVHLEHTNTDQIITQYKFGFQCIFQNLLGNSIQHCDKPEVRIGISYTAHPDFHQLVYRDNGPGIPSKYKDRVFELFEALGGNEKKSTGIGLTTVAAILNNIQGTIQLKDQEPGEEGVHFVITVPIGLKE